MLMSQIETRLRENTHGLKAGSAPNMTESIKIEKKKVYLRLKTWPK